MQCLPLSHKRADATLCGVRLCFRRVCCCMCGSAYGREGGETCGWPAAARAVLSRYACQCDVLFDLEYAKATARETCRELLFLILSSDSHLSTVFELGALCGVRGWCGVRRWGEVA